MSEEDKTEEQLRNELSFLRQRVAELEESLATHQQGKERYHQLCDRFLRKESDVLRESEKKYRELVDFLPISVFELDLEGNLVSANRATFETFGYHPEELEQGVNALSLGIIAEERDRVRGWMGWRPTSGFRKSTRYRRRSSPAGFPGRKG